MSHPTGSEHSYPEDNVTHYPRKKNIKMGHTVAKWAHSVMSPQEKALSKSNRRHESK